MKIPCKEIAQIIETSLIAEVQVLKQQNVQPKLVTFLLDPTPEQNSFVSIKERVGNKLGIEFELISPQTIPSLEQIKQQMQTVAQDPKTSGIIIQLPLPEQIPSTELYKLIPPQKEIEGHISNSHFQFPLSLAVFTGIKYIYLLSQYHPELDPGSFNNFEMLKQVQHDEIIDQNIIVNFDKDANIFRSFLQNKSIVIAGRGTTGGAPIAKAFDALQIPYIMTASKTQNPDDIYKNADIIITATGKKIINKDNIKPGVILLNVGLRKENGILKGDYDEDEIKDIASFYTETPGGLGPLDVLYLYKNVIDAAKQV
ncbi:MAG TPA: bifunctional 5,10-methylenetetrahydrofolate dehydrogenase/5,10-methenyltetrahydrofolate cyclohydrolase [Candidatus Woesebacteria bacterium]|nr:bifunctional 5,10-methylenetetrahydrofolate dehydrogenase/5,10-methenyltetrahydrofolate cyclohydrolase [Candidatus Woesebacteria bacterium]